jgi:hypothetical protein
MAHSGLGVRFHVQAAWVIHSNIKVPLGHMRVTIEKKGLNWQSVSGQFSTASDVRWLSGDIATVLGLSTTGEDCSSQVGEPEGPDSYSSTS